MRSHVYKSFVASSLFQPNAFQKHNGNNLRKFNIFVVLWKPILKLYFVLKHIIIDACIRKAWAWKLRVKYGIIVSFSPLLKHHLLIVNINNYILLESSEKYILAECAFWPLIVIFISYDS